jgi:uncharacterized protein YodC (DUF2158 family)
LRRRSPAAYSDKEGAKMAEQKFFTGQTVKLLSGGPVMTVMGTNARDFTGNMYVCQWFAGKTYKQAEFPAQNLKLAAPEDAPTRRPKVVRFAFGGR